MQITPKEYVGRTLTTLEEAAHFHFQTTGVAPTGQPRDAQAVLGAMLDNLDSLFRDEVRKREARSYIHELKTVRNKFAHSERLSIDDAYRSADTVARLLALLGADDRAAASLRSEIRRVATPAAPASASAASLSPDTGTHSTINVIACSKTKLRTAAPAVDLYTGPYFIESLKEARSDARPILILSTKYGLVSPSSVLQPYELSLTELTPDERTGLAHRIQSQLAPFLDSGLTALQLLGGKDYLALLASAVGGRVAVTHHPRWQAVWRRVPR